MKINRAIIALAGIAVAVLTGCSSDEKHLDLSHGGQAGVIDASTNAYQRKEVNDVSNNPDADKNAKAVDSKFSENQTNKNNLDTQASQQTIYFVYDSSEVEAVFIPIIEKQSQDLSTNSDHTLILEGHADERGSREYNIALGEERAKAVAKIMQARGVRAEQLEIISYGEEKPASPEHNEAAWHLNRRVNLISQRNQK